MIWEQKVKVIFCITRFIEGGKPIADKYWPSQASTEKTEDFSVTMMSRLDLGFYVKTTLELAYESKKDRRLITHYHLVDWNDMGVPSDLNLKKVIDLCRLSNKLFEGYGAPILVHCSAGVGRTGTFIALAEAAAII